MFLQENNNVVTYSIYLNILRLTNAKYVAFDICDLSENKEILKLGFKNSMWSVDPCLVNNKLENKKSIEIRVTTKMTQMDAISYT